MWMKFVFSSLSEFEDLFDDEDLSWALINHLINKIWKKETWKNGQSQET